jgi:hypothetical protein
MTKKKEWYEIVEIHESDAYTHDPEERYKAGDIVEIDGVFDFPGDPELAGYVSCSARKKYSRGKWAYFFAVKLM